MCGNDHLEKRGGGPLQNRDGGHGGLLLGGLKVATLVTDKPLTLHFPWSSRRWEWRHSASPPPKNRHAVAPKSWCFASPKLLLLQPYRTLHRLRHPHVQRHTNMIFRILRKKIHLVTCEKTRQRPRWGRRAGAIPCRCGKGTRCCIR